MRWLATLCVAFAAAAQPAWVVDRVRDAATPEELVAAVQDWKRGEQVGIQNIEFHAGAAEISGGLTFSLSRAVAAYDRSGQAVGVNEARYAPAQLIAGAPDWAAISSPAAAWRMLCTGFDESNVPAAVVRQGAGNTGHLDVHARTDPENYYNHSIAGGTYRTSLGGTNGDLLAGQTGAGGETAAITDHEFFPMAAWVYRGLVVVEGEHYINSAGWSPAGCGVMHNTVARLAGGDGWVLDAVDEDVSSIGAGQFGQNWSMSGFVRQQSDPDTAFVGWANYNNSSKRGGCANLSVYRYTAGAWSHLATVRLADNHLTSGDTEHWHCVGVLFDSSGNLHVLISVGDTDDYNRVIHRSLAAADVAAGNFGNGVTYSHGTYGDTGVGGSHVIEEPHANWSAESVVWGGEAVSTDHSLRHGQAINFRQKDEDCTALLCGVDETNATVYQVEWDETNGVPVFTCLYLPAGTSGLSDGMTGFMIEGNPGGPFCARFTGEGWEDGGTGGSGVTHLEGSILYSPDGDRWCHVASSIAESQIGACPHAGKIYGGASGADSPGYTPVPKIREAAPLQIASSPANVMSSGLGAASFTNESAGVTLTDLASDGSDLPADFGGELPPCDRGCMFTIVTGDATADRNHYGQATISGTITGGWSTIMVRAWVRPIAYDGSSYVHKADASVFIDLQSVTGANRTLSGGRVRLIHGQWTPVVLYATASQFTPAPPGASEYRLRLRAVTLSTATTPCHFAVCLEGLYVDGVGAAGTAPGSSAAAETATVGGVQVGSEWSLYAELQMPDDQWDNRLGGQQGGTSLEAGTSLASALTLFRLQGVLTDTLEVRADPANRRMALASDAASANGTANKYYFRRGDSMPLLVVCDGTNTTLYYETVDNEVASVQIADALTFTQIVSVDPTLWSRFTVRDGVDRDPGLTLRRLAGNTGWKNTLGARGPRSRRGSRRVRY